MWSGINTVVTGAFDGLLWPLAWLPEWVVVSLLGLPAAVFALLVFRYTSNQAAITRAKELIQAHLLELRLFQDDLGVTLRAQGLILRYNATYLRHALVPMLVMAGPFILILLQIESRFAFGPLPLDTPALLTVQLDPGVSPSKLDIRLEVPEGIAQDAPALRIDTTSQVVFRLRGVREGAHEVGVWIGDDRVARRVAVGGATHGLMPVVYRASDIETLFSPGEAALPAEGPAAAVELEYPARHEVIAGLSTAGWLFFASSMVFGFALRGALGVTF